MLFNWFKKKEQRAIRPEQISWLDLNGKSLAGVFVNENTALNISAVFCAVDCKSNDFASLPCQLFQRTEQGKKLAQEHGVYKLLHDRPNANHTNTLFRKTLMVQMHLTGNGYAVITRNNAGRAIALDNVASSRVRLKVFSDGSYLYVVDEKVQVSPDDMIHCRYFSTDGVTGVSPIEYARQSLAIAISADRFAASFFGNSGRPSGILAYEAPLTDQAIQAIKENWHKAYGGDNAGGTAILGLGGKYTPISMSFEDMQFLGLRQYSTQEVARWFNLPIHKLKEMGRATWNNISAENISYVRDSIRPLTIQFEEEAMKLLSPSEREVYFIEHNLKELLRPDDATRFEVYQKGLQNGIFSVNEVRAWENLEPIENGDIHLVPMNLADIAIDTTDGTQSTTTADQEPE